MQSITQSTSLDEVLLVEETSDMCWEDLVRQEVAEEMLPQLFTTIGGTYCTTNCMISCMAAAAGLADLPSR